MIDNTDVSTFGKPFLAGELDLSDLSDVENLARVRPFSGDLPIFGDISYRRASAHLFDRVPDNHRKNLVLWNGFLGSRSPAVGRYWCPQLYLRTAYEAAVRRAKESTVLYRTGLTAEAMGLLPCAYWEIDGDALPDQFALLDKFEHETGVTLTLGVLSGDTRPESIAAAGIDDPSRVKRGKSVHLGWAFSRPLDPAFPEDLELWMRINRAGVLAFRADHAAAQKIGQPFRRPSTLGYAVADGLHRFDVRIQTTIRSAPTHIDALAMAEVLEHFAGLSTLTQVQVSAAYDDYAYPDGKKPAQQAEAMAADLKIITSDGHETTLLQAAFDLPLSGTRIRSEHCHCPHHSPTQPTEATYWRTEDAVYLRCFAECKRSWRLDLHAPKTRPPLDGGGLDGVGFGEPELDLDMVLKLEGPGFDPNMSRIEHLAEIITSQTQGERVFQKKQALLEPFAERKAKRDAERAALDPRRIEVARDVKAIASQWLKVVAKKLHAEGVPFPRTRCGVHHGLVEARTGSAKILDRPCGRITCLPCASRRIALQAASISDGAILDPEGRVAGRGLAHGSGLDPKPKVFKYIIPNEGADRWLWRLRRAANHRYSAKEKNASGITVIRETYAVFRGVSGMTTCITDIQLPPSRKKGEDVQVDVIEGVETIRQAIFEQTLATYTGDSNEGIEDVHGNQFPHAVRGSVRTSRNIHIDAEEILRLASKSVWVLVERNTVSAKDAEAVIADLGIQIKEVSDGGQLAISSVTTAAIDDPQVMQSLWEAVRYGSGYNTRLAVQRTPPRMDDSIDDLFEEEVA